MNKIVFLGAGSTIFARNVLGDCLCTPSLCESEMALYDINSKRLEESRRILESMNQTINQGRATIRTYLGEENRKEALRGASFVINAIQVGGYDPCTIIDFEIPKNMVCGRPSQIQWALVVSCVDFAPSQFWKDLRGMLKRYAQTRCF